MPTLNRGHGAALISIIVATILTQTTSAYADWPPGGQTQFPGNGTSGNANGRDISATAAGMIRFDTSNNGSGGSAGELSSATGWTPPACWYAPMYTPERFKKSNEEVWSQPSVGYEWVNSQRDRYVNGKPYKNFNLDKSGKGYWWTAVPNPDRLADPAAFSCNGPPFWVDIGQPPPAIPNVITPEILAQLAYGKIRVPGTQVNLNPSGKQTVNLSTWAWLDKSSFKPVSVTASVDLLNISATTTATPVALHIDPGTPDADVYPASGDCPIQADGSIGTPYNGDTNATPPCGLTYHRATTTTGPYQLKATLTWKISWKGTGGAGGNLPNGIFATNMPVTVQEIQTVVH